MSRELVFALVTALALLGAHIYLMSLALDDLFAPTRRVRGYDKRVWAFVIAFVGIVGPLAYFRVGREE